MLQREHSSILSTFIKLPFVFKVFDLLFLVAFYTDFTVVYESKVLFDNTQGREHMTCDIIFIDILEIVLACSKAFAFFTVTQTLQKQATISWASPQLA